MAFYILSMKSKKKSLSALFQPQLFIIHYSLFIPYQKRPSCDDLFFYGLLLFFFLCNGSLDQLDDLDYGDHSQAKADCDRVFHDTNRCKAECVCKEVNLANQRGCQQRTCACQPQYPVLRGQSENAAALRTHVEAVEENKGST